MSRIPLIFLPQLAAAFAITVAGAQEHPPQSHRMDSLAVVETVNRFHRALSSGDRLAAQGLLAADLMVLEGGDVENRAQYLAHHLSADIEYAQGAPSRDTLISYVRDGNSAWAVSTSVARGKFRGRTVNSIGAELMILSRTARGWKIRAIHWSSSRR